jgi:hypothetical protein
MSNTSIDLLFLIPSDSSSFLSKNKIMIDLFKGTFLNRMFIKVLFENNFFPAFP